MKTSAIVCAVLAGTFGLGSVASAQTYPHRDRGDVRTEQRADRHDRQDRREVRRDDRRDDRQGWRNGSPYQHRYNEPRYVQQPRYEAPRHVYQQPRYVYQQPSYRTSHRFYRGGYLPHEYRRPVYYVNDWNAYPGLYQPPYGYQWMNVDGDFLLVALATGLIANALMH